MEVASEPAPAKAADFRKVRRVLFMFMSWRFFDLTAEQNFIPKGRNDLYYQIEEWDLFFRWIVFRRFD